MMDLLWQLGVLSAILVFGVKIGLAMGFAGLTKKQAVLITLGYGIGVVVLSVLCTPFTDLIYTIVYGYSSVLFSIMALVILYTGFDTVKEWRRTREDHATASCMAMIAPCPCCFGSIIASIILVTPMLKVSVVEIGIYSAIALMISMILFYLISEQVVKRIDKPFPVVLGNFMIFVGLYFLLSVIILPNMISAGASSSSPITIGSLNNLLLVIVGAILLMLMGAMVTKNNSELIRY
ncbi:MAG: DUF2162 domain-containing protein [Methanobacteriaceae archaeon]|nr:DUF2162 domain-containing protein [Methanobacteriaceae archaeon]